MHLLLIAIVCIVINCFSPIGAYGFWGDNEEELKRIETLINQNKAIYEGLYRDPRSFKLINVFDFDTISFKIKEYEMGWDNRFFEKLERSANGLSIKTYLGNYEVESNISKVKEDTDVCDVKYTTNHKRIKFERKKKNIYLYYNGAKYTKMKFTNFNGLFVQQIDTSNTFVLTDATIIKQIKENSKIQLPESEEEKIMKHLKNNKEDIVTTFEGVYVDEQNRKVYHVKDINIDKFVIDIFLLADKCDENFITYGYEITTHLGSEEVFLSSISSNYDESYDLLDCTYVLKDRRVVRFLAKNNSLYLKFSSNECKKISYNNDNNIYKSFDLSKETYFGNKITNFINDQIYKRTGIKIEMDVLDEETKKERHHKNLDKMIKEKSADLTALYYKNINYNFDNAGGQRIIRQFILLRNFSLDKIEYFIFVGMPMPIPMGGKMAIPLANRERGVYQKAGNLYNTKQYPELDDIKYMTFTGIDTKFLYFKNNGQNIYLKENNQEIELIKVDNNAFTKDNEFVIDGVKYRF